MKAEWGKVELRDVQGGRFKITEYGWLGEEPENSYTKRSYYLEINLGQVSYDIAYGVFKKMIQTNLVTKQK